MCSGELLLRRNVILKVDHSNQNLVRNPSMVEVGTRGDNFKGMDYGLVHACSCSQRHFWKLCTLTIWYSSLDLFQPCVRMRDQIVTSVCPVYVRHPFCRHFTCCPHISISVVEAILPCDFVVPFRFHKFNGIGIRGNEDSVGGSSGGCGGAKIEDFSTLVSTGVAVELEAKLVCGSASQNSKE
jgi:hypothetical protein